MASGVFFTAIDIGWRDRSARATAAARQSAADPRRARASVAATVHLPAHSRTTNRYRPK